MVINTTILLRPSPKFPAVLFWFILDPRNRARFRHRRAPRRTLPLWCARRWAFTRNFACLLLSPLLSPCFAERSIEVSAFFSATLCLRSRRRKTVDFPPVSVETTCTYKKDRRCCYTYCSMSPVAALHTCKELHRVRIHGATSRTVPGTQRVITQSYVVLHGVVNTPCFRWSVKGRDETEAFRPRRTSRFRRPRGCDPTKGR